MKENLNERAYAAYGIILIFILDYFIPPGTAMAILYLVPITIVHNETKRTIIWFALISTALAVMDPIIASKELHTTLHWSVFGDRSLSVMAVLLSSFIAIKHRALKEKSEKQKEEHIESLKKLLFVTSHKVRRPLANILGLVSLHDATEISQKEAVEIFDLVKISATELDVFSKELTDSMNKKIN